MKIPQWIKENAADYDDMNSMISACMIELGVQRDSVTRQIREKGLKISKKAKKVKKVGRDLSEFKKKYDKNTYIPQKIKNALDELGDAWEYEYEFINRVGIVKKDIESFRKKFAKYYVFLDKDKEHVWCGSKKTAKILIRIYK